MKNCLLVTPANYQNKIDTKYLIYIKIQPDKATRQSNLDQRDG